MNCPVHDQPFKLVPAGVSKRTGKSYTAFWACPERGCFEKPPEQEVPVISKATASEDIKFVQDMEAQVSPRAKAPLSSEDEKWNKIREEKNGEIRWLNALNNATLIVTSNSIPHEFTSRDDLEKEISQWANWFMLQEPVFGK